MEEQLNSLVASGLVKKREDGKMEDIVGERSHTSVLNIVTARIRANMIILTRKSPTLATLLRNTAGHRG